MSAADELSLFDEAGAARDEALARVEEHADPDWKDTARRIILAISAGGEFDTDHVWKGLAAAGVTTHEPRALGAVMRRLATEGEIRKAGTYRPSTRAECKARPIAVWVRCGYGRSITP